MSLAPIAVGAAVVTTAGRLWAKYIIHAPTMEEPGTKVGVENARRAARAALIAAALRGFDVIAIRPGHRPGRPRPRRSGPRHGRRVAGPSTTQPTTVYLVDTNDDILAYLEGALRSATS